MGLGPHPGNGVDVTSTAHGVTRKAASTRFGASLRSRGAICSPGLYQANQIELIRHCHQLAMDGLVSERFAIEHGAKHELGPRFSTKDFQFMVTSILTACLTPGDKSTALRGSLLTCASLGTDHRLRFWLGAMTLS